MINKLHLTYSELFKATNIPQTPATQPTIDKVLNLTFVTIGAIATLMFIIGGLRYIFARNNADSISRAKSTMTYSVVGMVITALAATLVNFVIGKLK